jgi:predicted RNase H-like nuclease (RuvC/YqgF family)
MNEKNEEPPIIPVGSDETIKLNTSESTIVRIIERIDEQERIIQELQKLFKALSKGFEENRKGIEENREGLKENRKEDRKENRKNFKLSVSAIILALVSIGIGGVGILLYLIR